MHEQPTTLSRRIFMKTMGVTAGAVALAPAVVRAQAPAPVGPPTVITTPPRDFGPRGAPTTYFTDPDVLTRLAPPGRETARAPRDWPARGGC